MRRSKHGFRHARASRSLRLEPLEHRHLLAAAGVVSTVINTDLDRELFTVDIRDDMAVEYLGYTDEVFFDMAFSPNGELYGIGGLPGDYYSKLYEIDVDLTSTGGYIETNLVGILRVSAAEPVWLNALEFRSDGTLFGAGYDDWGDEFVYSIEADTALATQELSLGADGSAGDLVFAEDGSMYITSDEILTGELLEIDPGLTSVTVVGDIEYGDFFGLTYGPGPEMYGFRGQQQVWSINRDDGSKELVKTLTHPELGGAEQILGAATLYRPPTDLGEVDFVELTGEEPVAGELWYRIEPARDAFLTVDLPGVDPGANIDLTLYRREPDGTLYELQSGTRRLDYEDAEQGAEYFLEIDGADSALDVRFTNLLEPASNGVVVHGTDGNDDFEFAKTSPYWFSINGVEYQFGFNNNYDVNITFNGGAGQDSARLVGSTSNDRATLDLLGRTIELEGPASGGKSYAVHVTGTKSMRFEGGGGSDRATLLGTPVADELTLYPTSATFTGLGAIAEVVDVRSITAEMGGQGVGQEDFLDVYGSDDTSVIEEFAVWPNRAEFFSAGAFSHEVRDLEAFQADPGAGPMDTAYLHGTGGADRFYADPQRAILSAVDGSYELAVTVFPYIHGYGEGGNDTAELWDKVAGGPDSGGNESVYAYGNMVKMIGETSFFFRRAKAFGQVTAYATGADPAGPWGDAAYLRDGVENDEFTASPREAVMQYDVQYTPGREVLGATVMVDNFDYIHGYALYGGTDTASLTDSPGDDTAISTPWYTKLFNKVDPANEFFLRAKYFEEVHATADSGGALDTDVARMYDSTRRDVFEADATTGLARMWGLDYDYDNNLWQFDEVSATADAGGYDRAELRDVSSSVDHLNAALSKADPDHWAELSSAAADYLYRVEGFERADAYSSDPDDEIHFDPGGEVADWLLTHGWV